MKKPKEIVLVTWTDSASRTGWTFPDTAREWSDERLTIQSSGFLYRRTKDMLILCQSFDSQGQEPNVCGLFQIPTCSIVRPIQTIARFKSGKLRGRKK